MCKIFRKVRMTLFMLRIRIQENLFLWVQDIERLGPKSSSKKNAFNRISIHRRRQVQCSSIWHQYIWQTDIYTFLVVDRILCLQLCMVVTVYVHVDSSMSRTFVLCQCICCISVGILSLAATSF